MAFIHSTIIWYLFFNCNTILYVVAYVSCAFRVSVHHKHDQRQHHLSVPGEFVSAHPRVGGGGGAKYSQSTRSPMGRTQPVYLTPSFSAHHSHPVCSFSLLSPPLLLFPSWYLQCLSCSQRNAVYSPPMLSLLCLTFSFWISLSQSTQVLFASFIVFV